VHNDRLEVKWATPDVRPAPFDRVMLAPIELGFRAVPPVTPIGIPATRTEFPVPDTARQRIATTFNEVLADALSKNPHFTLTDQPGPGVLLLKPALLDIVSRIPPDEPIGSNRTYVDSVADATLVVAFVDPVTGRTLGTATDRGTAEPPQANTADGLMWANPVSTLFEMRLLARRWGMSLENRVEQLYLAAQPR
jgi:hypothetical protein